MRLALTHLVLSVVRLFHGLLLEYLLLAAEAAAFAAVSGETFASAAAAGLAAGLAARCLLLQLPASYAEVEAPVALAHVVVSRPFASVGFPDQPVVTPTRNENNFWSSPNEYNTINCRITKFTWLLAQCNSGTHTFGKKCTKKGD